MHILIFAASTVRPGRAVTTAIASANLVIAADKGAATALHYNCTPSIIVGDLDSLPAPLLEQLRQQQIKIIQAPIEKDETDTELALQVAIQQGATQITLLGALDGSRFDHTVANLLLLAGFEIAPIRIIDGPTTCWLLRGPGHSTIHGQVNDLLSLFPLTADARGITTSGLYYPLHAETLSFGKPRGVSNFLVQEQAEVSLEQGLLLLIHTNTRELNE